MHKVVVERPRRNPGPGKHGRRANLPDELLPRFEGIRRPHSVYLNRKSFTDLLGPLRRWLHAQVGRPWDDVYSEACAVIKPDSVVRAHIKTHLLEFVQRHTFMKGDQVWCFTGRWRMEELPLADATGRWSPFYVHPETRLLCEVPTRPRHRWRDKNAERRSLTQRWQNESTLFRWLNGCWFECRMKKFPNRFVKGESPCRFDFAEKKMTDCSGARNIYGREVYCVAKRQLSRRDLRRYGLRNRSINIQPERNLRQVTMWACGRLRSESSGWSLSTRC